MSNNATPSVRENALVQMHCQSLARGVSVGVNADMFTVDELIQLVRGAAASKYRSKVRINKSKRLSQRDKARISSATLQKWRVTFH